MRVKRSYVVSRVSAVTESAAGSIVQYGSSGAFLAEVRRKLIREFSGANGVSAAGAVRCPVVVRELAEHNRKYPVDLPDLGSKAPPGGNSRLAGVATCYFQLRAGGTLHATY